MKFSSLTIINSKRCDFNWKIKLVWISFYDLNQAFRKVWMSSPTNKYMMVSVSLLKDFPVDAVVFGVKLIYKIS